MKRGIKLLIFDFDGTIADTRHVYYTAMKEELKFLRLKGKYIRKPWLSDKDIDKAIDVGLSLRKTLRKLGLSFIVSWFMHKKIMFKIKKYVEKVKKCKDVDSIKQIKGEKILISNSLREFMMPIIKHFKLKSYFKEIYGADDFDDKAAFIKNYLKKRKIKKNECLYIGDRVADVKTARKAGCLSVIVTGKCAWDSRSEIIKAKPDFIIDDIAEVSSIISR